MTGPKRLFSGLLVVLSIVLLIGCSETSSTDQTATSEGDKDVASQTTVPESSVFKRDEAPSTLPSYGYTYGQASGNRATEGAGGLPDSSPIDVELGGEPAWVVGVPVERGTAWVVSLEDGRIEAFRLDEEGSAQPLPVSPDRLAAGQPPAVAVEGKGLLRLLTSPGEGASTLTHPVPISPPESKGLLVVAEDGNMFVENGGGFAPVGSPQARALPDARAVRSPSGRIAVLSEPTNRYAHGVIGDDLEAGSITILEPSEESAEVVGLILPESGGVFELVSPLWFEGPSGEELLAVTESTPGEGSRIAVYNPGGELVAAGPFMGQEQRWRHLLAAGPFGPNGEMEIAAIRTPHIGGVVEFYAIDEDGSELEIAATLPGYSLHEIYSRNLDTARAGDLDGNGAFELVVPSQDSTELGTIRHGESGAEVAWTLPVGGVLATNLAATAAPDGQLAVAAGREGSVLRIWP